MEGLKLERTMCRTAHLLVTSTGSDFRGALVAYEDSDSLPQFKCFLHGWGSNALPSPLPYLICYFQHCYA
jgi:hypothetical protein